MRIIPFHWICSTFLVISFTTEARSNPLKAWKNAETFHVNGYDVSLSEPVMVAQAGNKEHLTIPSIALLANGDVAVLASTHEDTAYYPNPGALSFSRDGGLTWDKPVAITGPGAPHLRSPSGDDLFLPFYLVPIAYRNASDITAIGAPYNLIRKGHRDVELIEPGVEVTGWHRPVFAAKVGRTESDLASFAFNGQTLRLNDNSYFVTLYGQYAQDVPRIVGAKSINGIQWTIVATIAERKGKINERGEGPTESAVCRLNDGRLMCIYRVDSYKTYGQTWSGDDGATWTEPVECRGPGSVEPCLAVLKDGAVVLSGGRPGLKLWLNPDGSGETWEEIDVLKFRYKYIRNGDATGYTKMVMLDDSHLLYVYDYGFAPAGSSPDETGPRSGSIWVVRVTIEKTRK